MTRHHQRRLLGLTTLSMHWSRDQHGQSQCLRRRCAAAVRLEGHSAGHHPEQVGSFVHVLLRRVWLPHDHILTPTKTLAPPRAFCTQLPAESICYSSLYVLQHNGAFKVITLCSFTKTLMLSRAACRVRRGLENTCKPLGNGPDAALTYGRGLMQARLHFPHCRVAEQHRRCYSLCDVCVPALPQLR